MRAAPLPSDDTVSSICTMSVERTSREPVIGYVFSTTISLVDFCAHAIATPSTIPTGTNHRLMTDLLVVARVTRGLMRAEAAAAARHVSHRLPLPHERFARTRLLPVERQTLFRMVADLVHAARIVQAP